MAYHTEKGTLLMMREMMFRVPEAIVLISGACRQRGRCAIGRTMPKVATARAAARRRWRLLSFVGRTESKYWEKGRLSLCRTLNNMLINSYG